MINKAKYVFLVAAVWNFAGSIKGLLDINDSAKNFYISQADEISLVLTTNLYIFWWTVFTFGIGYLIVARNPAKNHGLIFIAAIGKTFVGLAWINGYLSSIVTPIALVGGIGDLLFALYFMIFLFVSNNSKSQSIGS